MSVNDSTWPLDQGRDSPAALAFHASNGQQSEEALRHRDEPLHAMRKTSLDGCWRTDREGKLLEVNSAYISLSGYTREELLGLCIFDLEAIAGATTIAEHLRRIIEHGSNTFESVHFRKDGSTWYAEVSAAYLDTEGGEFFASFRNIGERKGIDRPSPGSNAESVIRQRHGGSRILVVDDEALTRAGVRMLLEPAGLVVDTAEDGRMAIAMARRAHYAVILMDMQMPTLGGLEATGIIRTIPGYRQTPIIAMTANASAEARTSCLGAGMSDFMAKPFDAYLLFTRLLHALNQPCQQQIPDGPTA